MSKTQSGPVQCQHFWKTVYIYNSVGAIVGSYKRCAKCGKTTPKYNLPGMK